MIMVHTINEITKRGNLDWEIMEGLPGIEFTRQKVGKVYFNKTLFTASFYQ